METTVVLLKPDCLEKQLAGEVISRFEKRSYSIRACKMMRLSTELLREHYAHLLEKPFFPEILAYMQSGPVLALALSGENCIAGVRDLLGPTDSKQAAPGTVRGDYGEDKTKNIAHASDSAATAAIELERFFDKDEII
jgi:nucleoside-diphosphate kinase